MKNDKPLLRRPPGRPKEIYLIFNGEGSILRITKSIHIAMKRKPVNGSFAAITPGLLGYYFGEDPVVRAFLETYDGGIWLQQKRKGKE